MSSTLLLRECINSARQTNRMNELESNTYIKGRDRTLIGIDYVNNSHAGAE